MSIMDRVKNHISDNRGKYGVAAGVSGLAASQYAIENAPSMVNTAIYNAAAKGQNLALDTADKIGYGKEQLKNLGLENKIRQEDIDAGNDFYNSEMGQMINPSPLKMVNAAESSSELYNKVQEAKAQSQDVVQQAKAQFGNAYENGINYIKSLNPFNENTITIPIKSMLLEGYIPEQIVEDIIPYIQPSIDAERIAKEGKLKLNDPTLADKFVRRSSNQFINNQAKNNIKNVAGGALLGMGAGALSMGGLYNGSTHLPTTSNFYDVMDNRDYIEDEMGIDLPGITLDRDSYTTTGAVLGGISGGLAGIGYGMNKANIQTNINGNNRSAEMLNRLNRDGYQFIDPRYEKRMKNKLSSYLINAAFRKSKGKN